MRPKKSAEKLCPCLPESAQPLFTLEPGMIRKGPREVLDTRITWVGQRSGRWRFMTSVVRAAAWASEWAVRAFMARAS